MNLHARKCPGCLRLVLIDNSKPFHCSPCMDADTRRDELDALGRIVIQRNSRGQRVYQRRATHRIEETGPQRAYRATGSAIDSYVAPYKHDNPMRN